MFWFGGFHLILTQSCCVIQASLKHMIHPPQSPKHWYYINNILGSLFFFKRSLSYLLNDWFFFIFICYFLTLFALVQLVYSHCFFYFYIYFYSLEIIVHREAIFSGDWEWVTLPFLMPGFEVNAHSAVIPTADARAEVKGEFIKRYMLCNQAKLLCRAKVPASSPWEYSTKGLFKILIMYLYECSYFETI